MIYLCLNFKISLGPFDNLHPKIYELLDKGDRIGTFECIYIQIRIVLYVKKIFVLISMFINQMK
jgi:hypothetical protein